MEAINMPMVDYGIAKFVLPGENESVDHHLVRCSQSGILIAALDGIGHGQEAASAAKAAVSILKSGLDEPVISLVGRCHDGLRSTRGVVMSLASIDPERGMMTWLGVGNVQGPLLRAGSNKPARQEPLLLRAGVVGLQLPSLQAAVLPISKDDTLIFATDGVRDDFTEVLSVLESPQRFTNNILKKHSPPNHHPPAFVPP